MNWYPLPNRSISHKLDLLKREMRLEIWPLSSCVSTSSHAVLPACKAACDFITLRANYWTSLGQSMCKLLFRAIPYGPNISKKKCLLTQYQSKIPPEKQNVIFWPSGSWMMHLTAWCNSTPYNVEMVAICAIKCLSFPFKSKIGLFTWCQGMTQ